MAEMARSACREEGGGDGGETLRRRRRAERARSVCGEEGGGDGAAAATGREGDERVRAGRAASGKRHCRTVAEDTFFLEEFEKVFSGKFILPLSTV